MSVVIRDLTKSFSKRRILNGLNLTVKDGSCLGLMGASGSGKSTLLRIIAGFEVPDCGQVVLHDTIASSKSTLHLSPNQRSVGLVFQDLALWPHLTVKQHLKLVARHVGRSVDRARKIGEWLDRCQINHLVKSRPHQLSGGERQRLALARTLLPEPKVILLDEPFAGLDRPLVEEMKALVRQFQRDLGATMIMVSHDERDLEGADRMVRLEDGVILNGDSDGESGPSLDIASKKIDN